MNKQTPKRLTILLLVAVCVFTVCLFDAPFVKGQSDVTRLVQVQMLRSDTEQEHIFLTPQQSITYNASEQSNGLGFVGFAVQIDATDQAFLTQLSTDLYIQSYDYFGALGAWTSNTSFTLLNPTANTQELFLKITRNYIQTSYAVDTVDGNVHTIEFTSGAAADRVFVRWGVFASLSYLEVNGSRVDFSSVTSKNSVQLEFLPTYASFQIPPDRIQSTTFRFQIEQKDISPPSGYCYISAFLLEHKEITLQPNQQALFEVPQLEDWTFTTAAVYTNLTASLYPEAYPFSLINLSVWDPNANPLLLTAVDTTFGLQNLSNETYTVGFDVVYYYWQNQTALEFTHTAKSEGNVIVHEVLASVSDSKVGSEFGLTGQFLRFQLPGKTVQYDAPDPVGKYEQSYIPLLQGNYRLVTEENRIVTTITNQPSDLALTDRLQIYVTYNGEPYANAQVTVTQKGTFTSQNYTTSTNQSGDATVTIRSNGPESGELTVVVTKDKDNFTSQTITYFVGATWVIAIVVIVVVAAALVVLLVYKRRQQQSRKSRNA